MSHTSAISRRTLLGGASAVSLGLLAGCATKSPTPSSGGSSTVKQINFYGNTLGDAAQNAGYKDFIAAWEASSGSTVKPVTYPYDQAAKQLALLGAKFQGVAEAGPWQVLVPYNVLANLTDVAAGLGIPQGALDAFTLGGKLLGIPVTAAAIGLVVNGDIASAVGLKSGMPVEDFAGALEKIKQQDKGVLPYAAVTKNPDLKDAVHWMWGWGSEVVSADRRCTIGDTESVAAITWYKGLIDEGLIRANVARGDARILFAQGRTALYDDAPIAPTFARTNGASSALQQSITALSRPTSDGRPSFNRFWGKGLVASAGTGEATNKDFIKYAITNVAAATALYEKSSVLPSVPKVASQIPALKKSAFQTAFAANVSAHSRSGAWDQLVVSQQVDTTIGDGVARILAGQVGVQEGLNALKGDVQELLDQK